MSYPLPYFNRMIGEEFFKQESTQESNEEAIPYTVIQDYGNYEKRLYPEVNMVCTHHKVDTAGDSLAGLERVNPWAVLQSRRFQKTPQTLMFRRLFRYISGVNQQGEEVEMTTPVSTLHKIVKEDREGKIELHLMCFYLPEKYQKEGSQVEATAREAVGAPIPMEDSLVILHTRPQPLRLIFWEALAQGRGRLYDWAEFHWTRTNTIQAGNVEWEGIKLCKIEHHCQVIWQVILDNSLNVHGHLSRHANHIRGATRNHHQVSIRIFSTLFYRSYVCL